MSGFGLRALDGVLGVPRTRITTVTVLTVGSGTYFTPQHCTSIIVECVGPGGGGGGVAGSATQAAGAGGGGGGAYCRKIYGTPLVPLLPRYDYVVGQGGAGNSAANGSDGSAATTFGSDLSAPAGFGGIAGTLATNTVANIVAPGGHGGAVATGGDFNSGGQSGDYGMRTSATIAWGGCGGTGPWGGGARRVDDDSDGNAGTGPGGGGGGAVVSSTNTARSGGAGADGIIVITELYD